MGLLDRPRVRVDKGTRGRARRHVRGLRQAPRHLRNAHATPRRGRRRGRRRGAPHERALWRAAADLPPVSEERDQSRRGAASSSSTRPRRRGWMSRSTCTRACTGRPSCSLRCRPRRSRIPLGCARCSEAASDDDAFRSYESILSAGGDWSRIVLLDNDVWAGATRGATWRRSQPSATRLRSTPIYDLLLGAADDPGQ